MISESYTNLISLMHAMKFLLEFDENFFYQSTREQKWKEKRENSEEIEKILL